MMGLVTSPRSIMQAPLPRYFKVTQLESYDGITDLDNHFVSFRATMLLHGAPVPVLCKAFPFTLKGTTWYWYFGLKPRSVHFFEQLSRAFIDHFVSSRRQQRWLDYLHTIKRKGETIRAFVSRLNAAILESATWISRLPCRPWRAACKRMTLNGHLVRTYPKDFARIPVQAKKYEEAFMLEGTPSTSALGW